MIDPGTITLVQTTFLQHIQSVFDAVSGYALNLLYIFAALESCLFGLLWAFGHSGWERVLFKVLKIGLIFFVIENYSYLVNVILKSLAQVGGLLADTQNVGQFIFDPARLWQFGYNHGLMLLKVASTNDSVGLSILLVSLGIGILLVFSLIGIQIVLQLVGFYLVSLTSLIFLPFGTFVPSQGMFAHSVQSVLKAAVRVMTLIMVIGVAVTVWGSFDLLKEVPDVLPMAYNINQPLGLFFSGLLFLYLAIRLPVMAAESVGSIVMRLGPDVIASPVNVAQHNFSTAAIAEVPMREMQSATTVDVGRSSLGLASSQGVVSGQASNGAVISSVSSAAMGGSGMQSKSQSDINLGKASQMYKSISDANLKRLEKTLIKVLKNEKS